MNAFDLLHHNISQPSLGNQLPAKPDTDGFCMEADEAFSCIPFHHLVQKYGIKQPGIQSHLNLPQPFFLPWIFDYDSSITKI